MKLRKIGALGVAVAMMLVGQSGADLYNDAIGDEAFPNPHMDIVSVEVMNDASDIMFTINLTGDPIATDWGKYLVAIDSVIGGDTVGNGWGRPISMPSGMDYWIGSWVDWGDGAEVYSWSSSNTWDLVDAAYGADSTDMLLPVKTTNSVTLTTSLASMGLGVGDTLVFDVFTTGGGGTDGAIDALSDPNPTVAGWSDQYDSGSTLSYTVIPEPATVGLVGLFGLGMLVSRRIFRQK
jgi:hypothetical protein